MANKSSASSAPVSQQDLARAQEMWAKFTVMAKWSTIGVIALLALMAIFLL